MCGQRLCSVIAWCSHSTPYLTTKDSTAKATTASPIHRGVPSITGWKVINRLKIVAFVVHRSLLLLSLRWWKCTQ